LKGYTKGEHVLRLEAIVHNTRALHTGRVLEKFPAIVARLADMVDRFTTMLDCVDVGFLPGRHPGPTTDLIHDRCHPSRGVWTSTSPASALAAVLALSVSPGEACPRPVRCLHQGSKFATAEHRGRFPVRFPIKGRRVPAGTQTDGLQPL